MSDVSDAIEWNPSYRALKEFWIEKGKMIDNMQDLLCCYYASVTVVRIPADGRYMLMDAQIQLLHNTITQRCKQSLDLKKISRMLHNSDDLGIQFQFAFDHFSNDLHMPFNFMNISYRINPIPMDFGGNILRLAIRLENRFKTVKKVFEHLGIMVTSCIMLDCARRNLKGTRKLLEYLSSEYRNIDIHL